MTFQLPSPASRFALLGISGALAVLLAYFGLRNALATYYRELDTRVGYERAVGLEPANSRNWFFLGRSYLYDFEQPDTTRAIQAFQTAVALDPYSAESLLDLANAYEGEGDLARTRETFLAAQRIYPLSGDVCWSFGNFLLRQGEQEAAFNQFHKAVELDPPRAAEAFSRALLAQPDGNILLDKAVPSSPDVYVAILNLLAGSGDLRNAELVWQRLLALHPKIPIRSAVNFVDELLHQQRAADAVNAWNQAVTIMQNAPPPDPQGSLLWDGGFESGFSGAGFAWRFLPVSSDVLISFDRSEKHSGERSLRILFNGHENLRFQDVCHHFVPQPGRSYLLTGWVKTQSLTSSEGVRLQIFIYTSKGNQTFVSEEVHGTQPWKQIQLQWTDPPDGTFGEVCVLRNMSGQSGADIQGAAWLDDLSLLPSTEAPARP